MPRRPDSSLPPRGLTRDEAAAYVDVCPRSFDLDRAAGRWPQPTLPRGRYDRILLDRAMDAMSGLAAAATAVSPSEALAKWKEKRDGPRAA